MTWFRRSRSAEELLAEADAALAREEWGSAESLGGEALAKDPRSGHAHAVRAVALSRTGRVAEGFEAARSAAEANDPLGMFTLHQMYFGGVGTKRDEAESRRWCFKAADLGLARACHNLGAFYTEGRLGLARDPAEAIRWYERAIQGGHPEAAFNAAMLLAIEPAPIGNRTKATQYFLEAAKLGYPVPQTLASLAGKHLETNHELGVWLLAVASMLESKLATLVKH
jgi:TPR repeat protein